MGLRWVYTICPTKQTQLLVRPSPAGRGRSACGSATCCRGCAIWHGGLGSGTKQHSNDVNDESMDNNG